MLIDDIRAGESESLEFKRDVPGDPLKLIKTACAFANCNGGRIVVGVDDDRSVVGVDEMGAFRLADQLIDLISNSCQPQIPVCSEVTSVDRKTVIVLSVQMGFHCPYYVKSLSRECGTFVRVGATSRIADEDSLKELELLGSGRCFDSMVCRGLTTSESEIKRLCMRMHRLAKANCDTEEERRAVKKVSPSQLEDWGVLVRAGGKLLPTHAFGLLVGSRKFHAETRCGFFRGTTRATFLDHKDYGGSVLDQIEQAYEFILSKLNCGIEIVGTQSKSIYELPPAAIRELLVNAIVHRLYVNPRASDIMVAVYDDRVEVTSPGGIVRGLTLEMMMSGHSRSRNRALALAFRYMNFIESWGSGIPRIQKMLAQRGHVEMTVVNNGSDVCFTLWRKIQVRASTGTPVGAPTGAPVGAPTGAPVGAPAEVFDEKGLTLEFMSSKQGEILEMLSANPLSKGDIAKRMDVSKKTRTLKKAIEALFANGLIEYTIPERPDHKQQQYRLSSKGRSLMAIKDKTGQCR